MRAVRRSIARFGALAAGVLLAGAAPVRGEVTVQQTTWNGHAALRLSNGSVDVVVTTGVGPRVISYGFTGGENILGEVADGATRTALGEWRAYGGHRLWAAPEAMPRTYAPDNAPVEASVQAGTVRLVQATDAAGLQKTLVVTLAAEGTAVTVEHVLTNRTVWPVSLAPWALSVMRGGGAVIIPNEPYVSHADELLPTRALATWGYTDLSDPRWTFGPRFTRLRTDATRNTPQKIGVANRQGWAAYLREGLLFVKRYDWREGAVYPDFGVNTETFTNGTFIELETLGPLETLTPGASATHVERWSLRRVPVALDADDRALETALRDEPPARR